MGTLQVATAEVRSAATSLQRQSHTLTASAHGVLAVRDAAEDTDAAAHYDLLTSVMTRCVGQYGATTDQLGGAMNLAAQCYESADRLPGPTGGTPDPFSG